MSAPCRSPAAGQCGLLRAIEPSSHGALDPGALRAEGVDPATITDFSSNQSPLGAAPGVAAAVACATLDAYPDPHASVLAERIAEHHDVAPSQVVCGNGSTELIRLVAQLALRPGDTALALAPVFGECEVATQLAGARYAEVRMVSAGDGRGFRCDESALRGALTRLRPRLCWLCSPGNPTGAALPASLIAGLATDYPDTVFVLDEAYCDLLPEPQWTPDLLVGGAADHAVMRHVPAAPGRAAAEAREATGNVVVLRSMTKYWGLAGLRLGYALAAPAEAAALRAAAPPWNVNACAQAAGVAALGDVGHHRRAVELLVRERDRLVAGLRVQGWVTEPTTAGFFLVRVGDAAATRRALLARGCLVRDCASFGLPAYIRVSPRQPSDNDRLLEACATLARPEAVP